MLLAPMLASRMSFSMCHSSAIVTGFVKLEIGHLLNRCIDDLPRLFKSSVQKLLEDKQQASKTKMAGFMAICNSLSKAQPQLTSDLWRIHDAAVELLEVEVPTELLDDVQAKQAEQQGGEPPQGLFVPISPAPPEKEEVPKHFVDPKAAAQAAEAAMEAMQAQQAKGRMQEPQQLQQRGRRRASPDTAGYIEEVPCAERRSRTRDG